jgi:ribosomal protein L16 Arg81 hydroxylase
MDVTADERTKEELVEGETALGRILSPVAVDQFLDQFFCKAPLFVPGHEKKFDFLPQRSHLRSILHRATDIRAVFKNLSQASIRPGDVQDMFNAGATICITGLHYAHETLGLLTSAVRQELQFSGDISVRAYWSPAGGGFAVHYDPRIVTTLQLEGTKQWWYSTSPGEHFPLGNSPYPLSEEMNESLQRAGVESVVLSPGDVLCLPPGTWHWALAESDCFALNLAFDYMGGSMADLVAAALRRELLRATVLRAPLYRTGGGAEGIQEALLALRSCCLMAQSALGELADSPDALRALWERAASSND